MPNERPCGACGRRPKDMLGENHCLGCERDDLLEVAKAVHEMALTWCDTRDERRRLWHQIVQQARAAIAKATGKD